MNVKHVFLRKVTAVLLTIFGGFPLALQADPAISPETGAPTTRVMNTQSNLAEPAGFADTGIDPGVVDITPTAASKHVDASSVPVTEIVPTDARGVVSDQVGGIVSGQQPEDDRPAPRTFATTGVR